MKKYNFKSSQIKPKYPKVVIPTNEIFDKRVLFFMKLLLVYRSDILLDI